MTALETLTAEYLKNVKKIVEKQVREDIAALVGGTSKSESSEKKTAEKKAGKKAKKKVAYTYTFESKPCPICGKMNKGRRWRYYCGEHRKDDPQNKAE